MSDEQYKPSDNEAEPDPLLRHRPVPNWNLASVSRGVLNSLTDQEREVLRTRLHVAGPPVDSPAIAPEPPPAVTNRSFEESMQARAATEAATGFPAVRDALLERADAGKDKYGTYLFDNNGRDPRVDALQEALDLVVYLKQASVEGRPGDYRELRLSAMGIADALLRALKEG